MCREAACPERETDQRVCILIRSWVYGLTLCLVFLSALIPGISGQTRNGAVRRRAASCDRKKALDLHQALYRKWRSKNFDEVVGQEAVTAVLRRQVEQGKTSHAYLFCGSRGTGKTSCAKILSKAVNCENPQNGNPCGKCPACLAVDSGTATDVLELDAASNNGVDTVRDIRDEVIYSPSELRCRVYIIDEVHMLSSGAFNALLKTLEEPPAGVVFILATTEPHKLPATIVSRCQRFDFRRIPAPLIAGHLEHIAAEEGFEIEHDAAELIASLSSGGMRDAISLLELCSGRGEKISRDTVIAATGYSGRDTLAKTFEAILDHDTAALFSIVAALYDQSNDLAVYCQQLLGFARDLLVCRTVADAKAYLDVTESDEAALRQLSAKIGQEQLSRIISVLEEAYYAIGRGNSSKRLLMELALVRLASSSSSASVSGAEAGAESSEMIASLSLRVAQLEKQLAGGAPVIQKPTAMPGGQKKETANPKVPEEDELPPWDDDQAPPEAPGSPVPSEISAASAASAVKTSAVPKSTGAGFWSEVVAEYSKEDKGLGTLLVSCKAAVSGQTLVLMPDNSFAAIRLGDDKLKERLVTLCSKYADIRNVSVIRSEGEAPKDLLDELK